MIPISLYLYMICNVNMNSLSVLNLWTWHAWSIHRKNFRKLAHTQTWIQVFSHHSLNTYWYNGSNNYWQELIILFFHYLGIFFHKFLQISYLKIKAVATVQYRFNTTSHSHSSTRGTSFEYHTTHSIQIVNRSQKHVRVHAQFECTHKEIPPSIRM